MPKYRIVQKKSKYSDKYYYSIQKKLFFFWYYCDKTGCALYPGDLSKRPEIYDTIEEARSRVSKYKPEIVKYL